MSDQQFSLDWSGKLPVSAQIGMKQADDNANDRWKRWVDGCIQNVAMTHAEFTADDVNEALAALPDPPETHNRNALGPRMKEVAKTLKYMTATGRMERSKREISHGHILMVWKSNLYREAR